MANDGQPPAKRLKIDFDHYISIGPADNDPDEKERSYPIPQNLICTRSRRVAAYSEYYPDSTFRTDEEYSPETLHTYLQLLYSDQVVLTEDDSNLDFGEMVSRLRVLRDFVVDMGDSVSLNLVSDALVRYLKGRGEVDYADLADELHTAYLQDWGKSGFARVLLRFAAGQMRNVEFRKEVMGRNTHAEGISKDMLTLHFDAMVTGEAAFKECDEKEFHVGEKYFG